MTQNSHAKAPIIEAQALRKSYGAHEVLKGLDLSLERGEVVALIGPSGSGKSTFIRCLNMMEIPTGGTIRFRDKAVGQAFRDKGDRIGIGTLRRPRSDSLMPVRIAVCLPSSSTRARFAVSAASGAGPSIAAMRRTV